MAVLCRVGRYGIAATFSGHRPDIRKHSRPKKEMPIERGELGEMLVHVFSPFSINQSEREVIGLVLNGRFVPDFRHLPVESSTVNTFKLLHLIYTYPLDSVFIRVEEGFLLRLVGELSPSLDQEGWNIKLVAWRGSMIAGVYTYYGAIGKLVHTWWNPEADNNYPKPVRLVTHRPLT